MGKRLKASLSKGPPPISQSQWNCAETKHDESGQVYTEVSCRGGPATADWKWRTKGSTREHGIYRSLGPGCSSLYDTSVRSCLLNSRDITAETLREVPETIGIVLWNRIVAAYVFDPLCGPVRSSNLSETCGSQLDSVQVFLAFAERYPFMIGRKSHTILMPSLPLASYLKDVTSSNYQWLTHLTLLSITIPRTALIQVSLVTNLAVLTIGPGVLAPDIGADDNLIRTWSRSAAAGAFRMLRVLAMRDQPYITARAFEYLTVFPALAIFATESVPGVGPQVKDVVLAGEWKSKTGEDLDDWLFRGSATSSAEWNVISQALFELAGKLHAETLKAEDMEILDAFPVMHLAIGGRAENAVVDVVGEGAMRVWYRLSRVRGSQCNSAIQSTLPNWSTNDLKTESRCSLAPSTQSFPQKRALDSMESNEVRKKDKPAIRASIRRDIGDLLLGFGT